MWRANWLGAGVARTKGAATISSIVSILYALIGWLAGTSGLLVIALGLGNFWTPVALDFGPVASWGQSLAWNVGLFVVWTLQHIGMARPAFKNWLTSWLPVHLERCTYMLFTGVAAWLLVGLWQPMPDLVWQAQGPAVVTAAWVLFASGWIFALSGILYDSYFEFNGLEQVYRHIRREPFRMSSFKSGFVFRLCRRPTFFGILLACWATPNMTEGHLLFALCMTSFTLAGAYFVERTYVLHYGDAYRAEQRRKPLLVPNPLLLRRPPQ